MTKHFEGKSSFTVSPGCGIKDDQGQQLLTAKPQTELIKIHAILELAETRLEQPAQISSSIAKYIASVIG